MDFIRVDRFIQEVTIFVMYQNRDIRQEFMQDLAENKISTEKWKKQISSTYFVINEFNEAIFQGDLRSCLDHSAAKEHDEIVPLWLLIKEIRQGKAQAPVNKLEHH